MIDKTVGDRLVVRSRQEQANPLHDGTENFSDSHFRSLLSEDVLLASQLFRFTYNGTYRSLLLGAYPRDPQPFRTGTHLA